MVVVGEHRKAVAHNFATKDLLRELDRNIAADRSVSTVRRPQVCREMEGTLLSRSICYRAARIFNLVTINGTGALPNLLRCCDLMFASNTRESS